MPDAKTGKLREVEGKWGDSRGRRTQCDSFLLSRGAVTRAQGSWFLHFLITSQLENISTVFLCFPYLQSRVMMARPSSQVCRGWNERGSEELKTERDTRDHLG